MPITVKLIAQEDSQVLRTDNRKRFVVNEAPEWQFLFGPASELSNGSRIIKVAAEFDTDDLDSIRLAAYLYNPAHGGIDNSSSCVFRIYKVGLPTWSETLLHTVNGTFTYNSYFFSDVNLASLPGADLDGNTTLMIEAVVTRLSETYRDRIYVNHLGVFDSITRLRNDVEFLDLTKLDE